MDAVIMTGGKGARLLPYTHSMPKALLPLGDRPIIEILLRHLHRHGVVRVTIALGHMAQNIRDVVRDGSRFDLSVHYVQEDEPLGTCGAIFQILDRLGDNFILANGDLLSDLNVAAMVAAHDRTGADVTLGVFTLSERIPYGVLSVDADGSILQYQEKPHRSIDVAMGISVLRREAVRGLVPPGQSCDVPDLVAAMMAGGRRVKGFRGAGFWIDIGTPSDYVRAAELLDNEPTLIEPLP
jgi:NDP-mannose synthase